jgi:hypothetical protein
MLPVQGVEEEGVVRARHLASEILNVRHDQLIAPAGGLLELGELLRDRMQAPVLLKCVRPGVRGQIRDRGLVGRGDGEPAGEQDLSAGDGQREQVIDQCVARAASPLRPDRGRSSVVFDSAHVRIRCPAAGFGSKPVLLALVRGAGDPLGCVARSQEDRAHAAPGMDVGPARRRGAAG